MNNVTFAAAELRRELALRGYPDAYVSIHFDISAGGENWWANVVYQGRAVCRSKPALSEAIKATLQEFADTSLYAHDFAGPLVLASERPAEAAE